MNFLGDLSQFRIFKYVIKLLKNNFMVHFALYGLFNLLFLLFHSIIISIVAFFHFQLSHNFQTIERWIFNNCWHLLSIAKLLATVAFLKFFSVRLININPIFDFFKDRLFIPKRRFFVAITYLFIIVTWIGDPKYNMGEAPLNYDYKLPFISLLGNFVFFISDIIVIGFLMEFFPLRRNRVFYLQCIIYPCIFYFTGKIAVPNGTNFNFIMLLNMMTAMFLLRRNGSGLQYSILFCLIFLSPLNAFMGLDPIWGNLYSIFKFQQDISIVKCLGVWLIAIIYMAFTVKIEPIFNEENIDYPKGIGS